jgi:flagellin-like protein
MKKIWAIRKDAEAVSPVIATILMVAITVVLAAVLYVMVLGFGGTSTQTPTSSITKSSVTYGVKYTFAPMSKDTPWSDVTILLQDASGNTATWSPVTTDLDNGTTAKKPFTAVALGTITNVWCNVTDLAGNGYVNQGDFVTFQTGSANTFSSAITYTVTIMHDPTSAEICHASFNG